MSWIFAPLFEQFITLRPSLPKSLPTIGSVMEVPKITAVFVYDFGRGVGGGGDITLGLITSLLLC